MNLKRKFLLYLSIGGISLSAIFFGVRAGVKEAQKVVKKIQKEVKYTLSANPDLPKLVWKNLVTDPGFYTIQHDTIMVDDISFFYNKMTFGFILPKNREIHIMAYKTDSEDPRLKEYVQRYNNRIPVIKIHELGHARTLKYVKNYFSDKTKNHKLEIADEICRNIDQIILFADLSKEERDNYIYSFGGNEMVTSAHSKILKTLPDSSISSIKSDEYWTSFNKALDKDTTVWNIIVESAVNSFSRNFAGSYQRAIKKHCRTSHLQVSVDFYHLPISYGKARRGIFTVHKEDKKYKILNKISEHEKEKLIFKIDSLANEIGR